MFIVVCTYRARAGEQDAIVALHEDWQRTLRSRARGYLSGELLHSVRDPQAFTAVTRYEDETSARAAAADPEHIAWQRRLASLMEVEPTCAGHVCVWQINRDINPIALTRV
jgi:heme-degrading monooxygenase HmoA